MDHHVCFICGNPSVGKTKSLNGEIPKWHLCLAHLISATGNGFFPVFYHDPTKRILPQDGVRMLKERAACG